MTSEDALRIVGHLSAMYPRADFPKATQAAWMAVLCKPEHDAASVREAIDRVAQRSKFPPTLAELIDEAREVRRERIAEASSEAVAALPAVASQTPEQRAKARLHIRNIRAFLAGERAASAMVLEAHRIYVEERPFPAMKDVEANEARTEATLAGLKDKPGPLFRHLGGAFDGAR